MHHRWSLCNEYGCVLSEYNVTLTIGKKFRGIIKDLDKSRPISGAWNGDMKLGLMWAEQVTDMFGLNYNYQQCALPPATTRPSSFLQTLLIKPPLLLFSYVSIHV